MLAPSQSMKSASGSERPASKWQLKRTLRRKTAYRLVEPNDLRYLWAAYKRGSLDVLGFAGNLLPDEFTRAIDERMTASSHMGWALLIDDRPVGFVFAAWSPFNHFMEIVLVLWMPWASKRNIVESTISFISEIKKQADFIGYAIPEHKRLYEVAAMHGLVRRIGTSYNAIPGKAVAIFESRRTQ